MDRIEDAVKGVDAIQLRAELQSSSSDLEVTSEKGRELVLTAVRNKDAACVQVLLQHGVYKGELENKIAEENYAKNPTLLGEACSEQYCCKDVVECLLLSESDTKIKGGLHMSMMSQLEWNNIVSNSLKERGGVITRTVSADLLKTILSTCEPTSNPVFYNKLLKCNIEQYKPMAASCDIDNDMYEWLYDYLRFRCLKLNATMSVLKQMMNGKWIVAANELDKLDPGERDATVALYFPKTDDGTSWTLLLFSIFKNNLDMVGQLLRTGVTTMTHCSSYDYIIAPLDLAVSLNRTEICGLLLEKDKLSFSQLPVLFPVEALRNCINNKNVDIMKLLLCYIRFEDEEIPDLLTQVDSLDIEKSVEKELKYYLNYCRRFGIMTKSTEAFLAMEDEDIEQATHLVSTMTSVEVNETIHSNIPRPGSHETTDMTLVGLAVKLGHIVLVKRLIDLGANINVYYRSRDDDEDVDEFFYPLSSAVKQNNTDMCNLLLEHGASVEPPDESIDEGAAGYEEPSAMNVALYENHHEMLKILLKHGGELDQGLPVYLDGWKPTLQLVRVMMDHGHISQGIWFEMFQLASDTDVVMSELKTECHIRALVNLKPVLTNEFKLGLAKFREWLLEEDDGQSGYTADVCDYWEEYCRQQPPTLGQLCRYTIRQSCRSCDAETFKELGLPAMMEQYLCDVGANDMGEKS